METIPKTGGGMWQNPGVDVENQTMSGSPKNAKPAQKKLAPARCEVANSPDDRRNEHKRGVVMRLRRAEGQIRGVLRMIEQDQPCQDIAQQLAAVRKALDRAFFEMMACTLESEIGDSADGHERQERMTEVLGILSKYA